MRLKERLILLREVHRNESTWSIMLTRLPFRRPFNRFRMVVKSGLDSGFSAQQSVITSEMIRQMMMRRCFYVFTAFIQYLAHSGQFSQGDVRTNFFPQIFKLEEKMTKNSILTIISLHNFINTSMQYTHSAFQTRKNDQKCPNHSKNEILLRIHI